MALCCLLAFSSQALRVLETVQILSLNGLVKANLINAGIPAMPTVVR